MNFIIVDLECTCWAERPNDFQMETIEIGAVKYNNRLEKIGEFQSFIRPMLNPKLTEFCKELTSIKQSDVDVAPEFPEVYLNFISWCGQAENHSWSDFWLCSWGFFDKKQLKSDCRLWQLNDSRLNQHISIKHQHGAMLSKEILEKHGETKRSKQLARGVGMATALQMLNIPLEGTHHRAIDDARNIGKIFVEIFPRLEFRG